jgi:predicted ATPase
MSRSRKLRYGSSMSIPSAVRATVLERFKQMNSRYRDVVMCASAIGLRFDLTVLLTATAYCDQDVRAGIDLACNLGLVVANEDTLDGYAFRHALMRDIIYAELLMVRMRPLHRRIVRGLERTYASGGASLSELAYHAWASGNPRKSLRYNERAGDEAISLRAGGDARVYFTRARNLLDVDSTAYRRLTGKLYAITEAEPPDPG